MSDHHHMCVHICLSTYNKIDKSFWALDCHSTVDSCLVCVFLWVQYPVTHILYIDIYNFISCITLNIVLYFLLTYYHYYLSFQFEGNNLHQLVLKICQAHFTPISPRFSPDLQSLISQLFKVSPRDRPSINSILKRPFLEKLIAKYLTPEVNSDSWGDFSWNLTVSS